MLPGGSSGRSEDGIIGANGHLNVLVRRGADGGMGIVVSPEMRSSSLWRVGARRRTAG